MNQQIVDAIRGSISVKEGLLSDAGLLKTIAEVAVAMEGAFRQDKKVLLCGNGGSAADAQHIAAELSGRFYFDREPLFADALHGNTSYLTAVANDYSYDEIYARLVRANGRPGDILVGISTSGNSSNVIKAIEAATRIGMTTVAMTGASGGRMKDICNFLINVPSSDTPRIQEAHILIGHIVCELVEKSMFKRP
ncbi:MAG: D-sedoheptulose 7-phosphate isomerase [Candidatus Magnetobacterium sp. LHC-1]|uniref:Phosphoheptose isomerase n=1 Tax=Candidatus Magnetobacterium casense TaxID=1455061 RepID=A0ABS6RZI6_9BACT|nr:D-sedoheptulose 7-phosphate isomerase [Candidatus Magnetobacterium casensis]MBF0606347.1 D-sedoheptulose 7-phosphate isomerase [Nitrospirota bacterium]MBV6342058.1 D-sedoheptulose 7-phosphate isomerase [Candidatus Magnetobacterium casensis]